MRHLALAVLVAALTATAAAQSNVVPGRNVKMLRMDTVSVLGRTGTFPNGVNGLAESTTSCNVGTVTIPWEQAMDPDHPFISFAILREMNGRFEQISDQSFVKHGFLSLNSDATGCGNCNNAPGSFLGLGCADTYSTGNNGDNFWLGGTGEIDPWLGIWDPICSQFDKGEPPVNPPQDCDGIRSLTSGQANALGPVGHRIRVKDADFNVAGATFYYQGMYTIQGEAEALREDNIGSRRFTVAWNGTKWTTTVPISGNTMVAGTVLQRWSGASVSSGANLPDDGRVYVAVKVSGPVGGLYTYDYAVHNRDNVRGVAAVRLPICAGAVVSDFYFHDVDGEPLNDWSLELVGNELVVGTATHPLEWNAIYNFSFKTDAAPVAGAATLDAFLAGPGAAQFAVSTSVPAGLYNVNLGPGCSLDGTPPTLYATGAPAQATIPNASFGLESAGNAASATTLLFISASTLGLPLGGGCTQWVGLDAAVFITAQSDGAGTATFGMAVPNDPVLQGASAAFQAASINLGAGAFLGLVDLSNGLLLRLGNGLPGCP
jgi:hypothetical protein